MLYLDRGKCNGPRHLFRSLDTTEDGKRAGTTPQFSLRSPAAPFYWCWSFPPRCLSLRTM